MGICRAGCQSIIQFWRSLRQLRRHAWYKANAGGTTHPVGHLRMWDHMTCMAMSIMGAGLDWRLRERYGGRSRRPCLRRQADNAGLRLERWRPRLLVVKSLVHSAELERRRLHRLSPAQSSSVTLGPRHAAPRLVLRFRNNVLVSGTIVTCKNNRFPSPNWEAMPCAALRRP